MPHRALASLAFVAVFALAACGGSSAKSDSDQISDLIKDVANNPASLCDKYATSSLLAASGGKAKCDQGAAAQAKAKDLKIGTVTVNGTTATVAESDSTGGATVTLVKQDGNWMVASAAPAD